MAKAEWDYALQIKGVTLNTLPMDRIAQYLTAFASLLGEKARPRLAGVVRGSVVLRAKETSLEPKALVRARVRHAANDESSPGHADHVRINLLLAHDGARARLIERDGQVLTEFIGRVNAKPRDETYLLHDTAAVDGVVVGIQGVDDTVHARLQDVSGRIVPVTLRDMAMARELATHFRSDTVRVHVHGTWQRSAEGKWEPLALYADRVELIGQETASEAFDNLARNGETGWQNVADADALWRELRGIQS